MQKDKFHQAAGILEDVHAIEVPATSRTDVLSPKNIRKNSALYWETKFKSAQALIEATREKNLELDQIPGLLTINKITPKKAKSNVRVTQVCGSMEGKDMLQVVKSIKQEKARKVEAQKAKENQKVNDREAFYKCKETCTCHKSKCEASGLKECSSCHNILRSVCGKAACRKNGKRPLMISSAVGKTNTCKSVNKECDTDDSASSNDNSEDRAFN